MTLMQQARRAAGPIYADVAGQDHPPRDRYCVRQNVTTQCAAFKPICRLTLIECVFWWSRMLQWIINLPTDTLVNWM